MKLTRPEPFHSLLIELVIFTLKLYTHGLGFRVLNPRLQVEKKYLLPGPKIYIVAT